MLPFQPSEETSWIEKIRRKELTRCAVALHKLAVNIQLTEDYITKTPAILAKLISKIATILAHKIPTEVPTGALPVC